MLCFFFLLSPSASIVFGFKKPPALAVAKGSTVSLFPSITVTPTAGEARSTTRMATEPALFTVVEWEAHDHNVTGISTVPFQAPLAADSTRGLSPLVDNSGVQTGVGQTGVADGGDDRGASAEHTVWRRSTAVVYTCSMDGHCKEWEVLITGGEDGGAPVVRFVSRPEVS